MSTRPLRRRCLALLLAPLALALLGVALAACGSSQSQLTVRFFAPPHETIPDKAHPGDTLVYHVEVANHGPGDATGVRLSIDLPAAFTYLSTTSIDQDPIGAARTQAQDPARDTRAPRWGVWHLDPPTTNADGTPRIAFVAVTFQVHASGDPGQYQLIPHTASDASDGDITGQAAALRLDPAADLHVDVSVAPQSIQRGQELLYRVTIDNFGTGPAADLGVLLTLPAGVDYVRTESIEGNAARDQPVDPIAGTLEVYFGGFTIPAKQGGAPGSLVITLRARDTFATGGRFTADCQVTDKGGMVTSLHNVAPVTIDAPTNAPTAPPPPRTAPPTTAPVATPAPTPTPTAKPGD